MIRHKLISSAVRKLLLQAAVYQPAVDVVAIAQMQGALVVEESILNEEVSGFLYRTGGSAPIIGVNMEHPLARRRFTIAHEIGHLVLHPKTGVHLDQVMVQMRNSRSSDGSNHEEVEANRFAAELLMPEDFLLADLGSMGALHADDSRNIEQLATRYIVSVQAMTIRLSTLGLICM